MTHYLDFGRLDQLAETHGNRYRSNQPFPHIVLDDFAPRACLQDVLAEFPSPARPDWDQLRHKNSKKLALNDLGKMGETTRGLLNEFNSSPFVSFLEQLTGIAGLIPDPHFTGGGLHQIEPGGFLRVHADFNWHERLRLDRRINLLLYLNENWKPEYGGDLELWNADMTRAEQKISPVFNRCVVFSTTEISFHGHPDPLRCPADMSRKSIALYYYTNGRPAEEVAKPHSTLYQERPGARDRHVDAREVLKKLVPPILFDVRNYFQGGRGR